MNQKHPAETTYAEVASAEASAASQAEPVRAEASAAIQAELVRAEASVAIQVLPHVDGPELIRVVDAVIAYIRSSGLPTFVGPFETTVEGEYGQLMEIVRNCQLICIREGAPSVLSYVKIAYNPQGVLSIGEKVAKHQAGTV